MESINGLTVQAEYTMSGWMFSYNHDDFTNSAVTSQIPGASVINRNNGIVGDSSTTIGIIDNVDRSVKGAVIR